MCKSVCARAVAQYLYLQDITVSGQDFQDLILDVLQHLCVCVCVEFVVKFVC